MELILTVDEQQLLTEILAERHVGLQREISHTDHISFKRVLRRREDVLESLIGKVTGLEQTA